MEKILLCVLMATAWALAFEIPNMSVNFQVPSLPRDTDTFAKKVGLVLETPGSPIASLTSSIKDLTKRVNKLEKDREGAIKLMSKLSVDCGSPTPPVGTDVVYSSTGLHAVASYRCKRGFLNIHPGQQMMSLCQEDGNWTMVDVNCVNISACSTARDGKVFYTGTRSTTITGRVCQRWDSQLPHAHDNTEDGKFYIPGKFTPQTVTGSANYCRDPDHTGSVWCYTTDTNTRWEKCDVPMCNIQS